MTPVFGFSLAHPATFFLSLCVSLGPRTDRKNKSSLYSTSSYLFLAIALKTMVMNDEHVTYRGARGTRAAKRWPQS